MTMANQERIEVLVTNRTINTKYLELGGETWIIYGKVRDALIYIYPNEWDSLPKDNKVLMFRRK